MNCSLRLAAVAIAIAGSVVCRMEARAGLPALSDLYKQAAEKCADRPIDERGDCEQGLLAEWTAKRAQFEAVNRYADEILTSCKESDDDRYRRCSERMLARYPASERDLVRSIAFVGNVDRSIKREDQRLARALQSCHRAGITQRSVRIGMSTQSVRDCGWGEPDSINRTTTARRVSEQWVYPDGSYLYFENGKLTAIQN